MYFSPCGSLFLSVALGSFHLSLKNVLYYDSLPSSSLCGWQILSAFVCLQISLLHIHFRGLQFAGRRNLNWLLFLFLSFLLLFLTSTSKISFALWQLPLFVREVSHLDCSPECHVFSLHLIFRRLSTIHLNRIFFVFVLPCVHRASRICGFLSLITSVQLSTIITASIVSSLLPLFLPSESSTTRILDCLMSYMCHRYSLSLFFFLENYRIFFLSLLQFG